MHILVLGAGVTGVTSAWYLARAGFRVTVVERRPEPALETSFANGGQISVSHPEPWASPSAPRQVLRGLFQADAPVRWRPRLCTNQWRWALGFARECLPHRFRRNTAHIARLARHSLACLRTLRQETGLEYDAGTRGILHLYEHPADWREAARRVATLNSLGIPARALSPDACLALDPALAPLAARIVGAIHAPDDESGDARRFTQALSRIAADEGVRFLHDCNVEALVIEKERVDGARVRHADGSIETMMADAVAVCLGSHSATLMRHVGVRVPIYPLKGYSVSLPVIDAQRAPTISLTDESRRIVCSRLGDSLRVAGTAELDGFDLALDPARCQPLMDWASRTFPGALALDHAEYWTGLRPATPSNRPLIGRSRIRGLWLNTGHGSLGWTLACGSAHLLAEWMAGRPGLESFPQTTTE